MLKNDWVWYNNARSENENSKLVRVPDNWHLTFSMSPLFWDFFDEDNLTKLVDGFLDPGPGLFLSSHNTRTRARGIGQEEGRPDQLAPQSKASGKRASQHHPIPLVTTCVLICVLFAPGQMMGGWTVKAPAIFMLPLKISSCLLNFTSFLHK